MIRDPGNILIINLMKNYNLTFDLITTVFVYGRVFFCVLRKFPFTFLYFINTVLIIHIDKTQHRV